MNIRARLSRIESAITRNGAMKMRVTSDDLQHLTDDELDHLESIVVRVGKITGDDEMPVPDEYVGDDIRAFITYLLAHGDEYLAAVQSLVDKGRI